MNKKERNRFQFRAFNKKVKTMIDCNALTPFAIADLEQEGVFIPFCEDVKIMQSTGMIDVDLNFIYEYDYIFSYGYPFYDTIKDVFNYIGKVIYNYNDLCFEIEFLKVSGEVVGGVCNSDINSYSNLEILGNSFEHNWEQILEKLKEQEYSNKK